MWHLCQQLMRLFMAERMWWDKENNVGIWLCKIDLHSSHLFTSLTRQNWKLLSKQRVSKNSTDKKKNWKSFQMSDKTNFNGCWNLNYNHVRLNNLSNSHDWSLINSVTDKLLRGSKQQAVLSRLKVPNHKIIDLSTAA